MVPRVIRYTEIKSAETCHYDAIALGEVMLRFDPMDVPTSHAKMMRVFQGGGETNVACGMAYTFGLRTAVITALVDDDIGRNIRDQLRAAGVDVSKIIWFNTNNDGSRFSTDQKGSLMNGINFTFAGKGVIPAETVYYRAHTAVRELRENDVDWEQLFCKEGARVFYTGGIYMLISPSSAGLAIQAARLANQYGTMVAADLNYRAKIEPNKAHAREIIRQIVPYVGFLVGNDQDMHDALGYETPVNAEAPYEDWISAYHETLRNIARDFPNLSLIGTQWRGATNADTINWGAILYDTHNDKIYQAPLRTAIPIADRTGGGDSFASGVLAALLNGKDLDTAVQWGAAHGILVQETPGDITMVTLEKVVAEATRAYAAGGVRAIR